MRILHIKEEEEDIHKIEEPQTKRLTPTQKRMAIFAVIALLILGVLVGSPYLGSIFSPYSDDEFTTGWTNLNVFYMDLNEEIREFNGECQIDLFYIENNSKYQTGLTLDAFPYHISAPTAFLFTDTSGEFEYYYGMLLGNPSETEPYENEIFLRREISSSNLEVETTLLNFTYDSYSEIDLLVPNVSQYLLSYNESLSNPLPFGEYSPRLSINITNLPFGYSWGVSSIIPPDLFEAQQSENPIAYDNGFNWKGPCIGFNGNVKAKILLYGAENYHFFEPLQIYEVNLTQDPEPEQLWVALLPTVDIESTIIIEFNRINEFSHIYLWSGWLDEYQTQYIYNEYTLLEEF